MVHGNLGWKSPGYEYKGDIHEGFKIGFFYRTYTEP